MAVAITATEQDVYPPRVLVSVTGLTIGDNIELYRSVGGRETPLRAASAESVTDTSFLRTDAELPFGVPVRYLAFVNGADRYYTGDTTYTLTGGKPVITDAISGLTSEAVIMAWDEKRYSRRASVFQVGGRNVVVSGDMGMFEGSIELFTETTSSRDNVMEALTDGTEGVVQIRQPGGYDGVDSYLAVTGVSERRFSQDGSDERRLITVDAVEVEGWAPALEARGFTLQDINNVYNAASVTSSYTFASTTESWFSSFDSVSRVASPSQVGDGSLLLTPGGVAVANASSPVTALPVASAAHTASTLVYSPLGWVGGLNKVRLKLKWHNASNAFISEVITDVPAPAGVWVPLSAAGTPPVGATKYQVSISLPGNSAPTTSDLLYIDWAQVEGGTAIQDLSNAYATLLDIAQADFS